MTLRACAHPGCPTLTTSHTRCPQHTAAQRKASDTHRPNANQRGYGSQWRRTARTFLRAHPTCIDCGDPATVPDHSPLTRRELVAHGITNPDAPAFLRPRCKPCHDRKTVREDGGFGRQPTRVTPPNGWPPRGTPPERGM